jgi:nicotinamidase-related amidase
MNKRALLIVDIQNDYFDGGKNPLVNSLEASLRAKEILGLFRSKDELVIHIRHISLQHGATFFLPNTEGAEIHANVQPLAGEKIIEKHSPNSFKDTELQDFLSKNEVTDLIICGMMTHMCIDATTRAAKDLGYNCCVIADACSTKDLYYNGKIVKAEDVHAAFLSALNGIYARVFSLTELQQRIRL